MVQCALRACGIEPDRVFTAWQRKLSVMVICSAPFEPPRAADDSAVQQAVRHKSTRYKLVTFSLFAGGKRENR